MLQFFAPSYDTDFNIESSLDRVDEPTKEVKESKKPETLLTDDDMTEICSIHSHLAKSFTYTCWLRCETQVETRSYLLDSFYDRYRVFAAILKDYHGALNETMDMMCLPGSVLMTSKAQKFSSYLEDFQDFYHNSDVDEVYTFYPILMNVREHTEKLLKSWEDNPVLLKVKILLKKNIKKNGIVEICIYIFLFYF